MIRIITPQQRKAAFLEVTIRNFSNKDDLTQTGDPYTIDALRVVVGEYPRWYVRDWVGDQFVRAQALEEIALEKLWEEEEEAREDFLTEEEIRITGEAIEEMKRGEVYDFPLDSEGIPTIEVELKEEKERDGTTL